MIRPVLAEIAGSWPSALQFGADVGGAAVLPDDGAVHGLPGGAVPHHGGLALVGDADRGDVLGLQAGLFQRLAADRDRRGPDVLGLVLDPAGRRKMLREFLLRGGGDGDVAAEHDGARGRGALIDGQHEGHDVASREVLVAREAIRLGGEGQFRTPHVVRSLSPLRERVGVRAPRERGRSDCARSRERLTVHSPRVTPRARRHPPPQGERDRIYIAAVVTPPSTTMVWPVMKVEASEPR